MRFPAIVLRLFQPNLPSRMLHLEAWGGSATALTKECVPVSAWTEVTAQIAEHVDLSSPVSDVLSAVSGEAGVGKTRMTFETLRANPSMGGLVLYCDDGRLAIDLARYLAGPAHMTGNVFGKLSLRSLCPMAPSAALPL